MKFALRSLRVYELCHYFRMTRGLKRFSRSQRHIPVKLRTFSFVAQQILVAGCMAVMGMLFFLF